MKGDSTSSPTAELTVVVPTFNESGNVEVLIERLDATLSGETWRVIFVDDDSPDGTGALVKSIAARDDRVQCLRRTGRRGLAGAVIEGILASASPFVAVIDGDLQHDETLLPAMLQTLRSDRADLVVGTRFATREGISLGLSPIRKLGSRAATWAARRVLRAEISDPVSGFFMVRRDLVERVAPKLSHQGFKILFDIVASQASPPRIAEIPYAFAERVSGASKLDSRVVIDYAGLLVAKLAGDIVAPRTVIFLGVAGVGVAANLAVLGLANTWDAAFLPAQAAGALIVLFGAFAIDTTFTRRSLDLRALGRALPLALMGLLANLSVADLVWHRGGVWWLAGLAGAAVGAFWTYVSRER